MANLDTSLEFTETVSPAFIGQIVESIETDWHRLFRPWYRRTAFFAAFIVLPGILGGLHITSDRFNVGLMVGGILAMIMDERLQKPLYPKRPKATIGRFDKFRRTIGRDGLTIITHGRTSVYSWARITKVEKFPLGLALYMGPGLVFPIENAQLPPDVSSDEIFALVETWRDAATKNIAA